nr:MAG TPA: hypothetical protein [Caudoviricetes sp.]
MIEGLRGIAERLRVCRERLHTFLPECTVRPKFASKQDANYGKKNQDIQ